MLEFLAPSFLYTLAKDGVKAALRLSKGKSPEEKIALRQKWKPQFEEEIRKNFHEKLRSDVVIRDVKRVDSYPDIEEKKGISPWFRVGLLDIYHRGILVGLRWTSLIELPDGTWRAKDHKKDGQGEGIKVILAGQIPFEGIESVDFDGDEYYYFPHIFCHFIYKGEPYETMAFYAKNQNSGGKPFYTEVASYSDVRKISKKLGIDVY